MYRTDDFVVENPCVNCGRPTTRRWCSDACHRFEDGYDIAPAKAAAPVAQEAVS